MYGSNLKKLVQRYRKNEESLRTILLRGLLFPNKIRYNPATIFNEVWDYLIVLDACRYDFFKGINEIPGKLDKIISAGTHTSEWSINNFKGGIFKDIIYISATPQVSNLKLKERIGDSKPFFLLDNVWDWGWNEELGTVHPKKVNEATLKLKLKYPEKKFIIHYVQPHSPFIGNPKLGKGMNKDNPNFRWEKEVIRGSTSIEEVKEAYAGNLELVLKYVDKLIKRLDGKVVVTSDHGEAFGEFGVYSHLPKMYVWSLMEVPWLVIEKCEN